MAFEEIASEFGHGQPSAEAIQSFLAYAFHSWSRPSPRYVLLLGDSTYDPRNFTRHVAPLAAAGALGEDVATCGPPPTRARRGQRRRRAARPRDRPAAGHDARAGRRRWSPKLIAWEDSGQGLAGTAALVADNPDLAGDFEADVRTWRRASSRAARRRSPTLSELGAQTRPSILDALNSGLSLLGYVGHGGAAVWACENVLNSWDVPSLGRSRSSRCS